MAKDLPDIDWKHVYLELGMTGEYGSLIRDFPVPPHPDLWTIPVVEQITANKVVRGFRRIGLLVESFFGDLDKDLQNGRDPGSGKYLASFLRSMEAEETEDVKQVAITLPERLLLGLGYYLTKGSHLDVRSVCLCLGSRYANGGVPTVDTSPEGRIVIGWEPGGCSCAGILRTRNPIVVQR